MENKLDYGYYKSPIGIIKIVASDEYIKELAFVKEVNQLADFNNNCSEIIKNTIFQLNEYFQGKRRDFCLPLQPKGTCFQQRVWQELEKIDYGKTASYKEIALKTGNEKATRAVGGANNKNPIAIIIPCHRVIGTNGSMVGYSGGLDKKLFLLNLEIQTINKNEPR